MKYLQPFSAGESVRVSSLTFAGLSYASASLSTIGFCKGLKLHNPHRAKLATKLRVNSNFSV